MYIMFYCFLFDILEENGDDAKRVGVFRLYSEGASRRSITMLYAIGILLRWCSQWELLRLPPTEFNHSPSSMLRMTTARSTLRAHQVVRLRRTTGV